MNYIIVDELILALQEEIQSLKKGGRGNLTRLTSGKFERQASGLYIYSFSLENFLVRIDDTPAELRIGKEKFDCRVISSSGQKIQLAITRFVGDFVPQAELLTNLWYLLQILVNKFIEAKKCKVDFSTSQAIFTGKSYKIAKKEEAIYAIGDNPPNNSQIKAIDHAYHNSLAIIWGPPGTGKTKTIANLIEAHLRANQRVLLVSHANAAVDQALASVASHLKDSIFYQEGKLVRLGISHDDTLDQKYPFVILENIVKHLGYELNKQREQFVENRKQWQARLDLLQTTENTLRERDRHYTKLETLQNKIKELDLHYVANTEKLNSLKGQEQHELERLNRALQSGKIKRFILQLDPEKIQQQIEKLQVAQETLRNKLEQGKCTKVVIEQDIGSLRKSCNELETALIEFFVKLKIDPLKPVVDYTKEQNTLRQLDLEIRRIDQKLKELNSKVLEESKLVATTLTQTYTSQQFPRSKFDVVIIDEASMAPLPQVYWVSNFSTKHVTIVGDFNQLPPICKSTSNLAVKWLKRNIFDVVGINSVVFASQSDIVTLLNIQYRMAPEIAKVSSQLFYKNLIENAPNTYDNIMTDPWTKTQNPLVLVDTSKTNPWFSRISTGGFFNIYNALVAASLATELIRLHPELTVGIATPFRAQARLIRKIIEDWKLEADIRIDTIHSFQGGERDVMIIDTVETQSLSKWSIFDETRKDSDSNLLLNVALTRGKKKVFLIAHTERFRRALNANSNFIKMLDIFVQNGSTLPSETVTKSYLDIEFSKWVEMYVDSVDTNIPIRGSLFNQDSFWGAFLADINSAEKEIVVMSPFISMKRTSELFPFFYKLVGRGVKITIFTRPVERQIGILKEHSKKAIKIFEECGIEVILRNSMHQKVALIDHKIAWEGSLNILSHNKTEEQMRRLEGEKTVRELMDNLELERERVIHPKTKQVCHQCGSAMVRREGSYGPFFGCSNFPRCTEKMQINR